MAMADTHGTIMCWRVMEEVAFKLALALASRPYGDDGPNERKVGGAVVMAGHGRA